MESSVRYPARPEDWQALHRAVSAAYAEAVQWQLRQLPCPAQQKRQLLGEILQMQTGPPSG